MNARIVEPFLWSQSYQLAAEVPDTERVDTRIFRAAFGKHMGLAGLVPNTTGRVPQFGGYLGKYLYLAILVGRRARRGLGLTSGYQESWSPDRFSNRPIRPEDHYTEEGRSLLHHRLNDLLADGRSNDFFKNENIPKLLRVRALALGFS